MQFKFIVNCWLYWTLQQSCIIIIHWTFFWLAESIQWIFEISTCDAITADYTITGNTGNCVLYDCGAWFLRVITSSSLALFCLSSVKKQKNHYFCFVQCIIKQLLHSVFAIPRIMDTRCGHLQCADTRCGHLQCATLLRLSESHHFLHGSQIGYLQIFAQY